MARRRSQRGDGNYEVWRRLLLIEVTVSERQDRSSGFGGLVDRRLNPRLLSSKQLGIVSRLCHPDQLIDVEAGRERARDDRFPAFPV